MLPTFSDRQLEAEFSPTIEDFERALALQAKVVAELARQEALEASKGRKQVAAPYSRRNSMLILAFTGSMFLLFAARIENLWRVLPEVAAAACFLALVFLALNDRWIRRSLKQVESKSPQFFQSQRVAFTAEVVILETAKSWSATMLGEMMFCRDGDIACLVFPGNAMLPIPSHGSFGRESFDSFCANAERLVNAARDGERGKML
jgi:hypothetical protein